ncbi:Non-heme chloroperoxidase [Mycobacterium marinum]|uniref:alpha/beta fold hydrolase n=1 Tax=Mycobacterium marinum TaxID=1781 RepID=UPI000CD97A66|nr:alpha/beta hydrolase [Mycobacterium marinum]AXN51296.1 Non-heme chloroperoxidase [Mycobacterium marinum]RFZ02851.1 Non-heme chloroperoxidase [Mycobacterium marinum]RFZ26042.1 Non-heme chloroperoxidase [Mycobacterium marinum]RFZ28921.1 Non-heme chloroperoxidase [Mycobacterium marinum]WOR03301.1 alpha/beta hydrolase [Mycobacterium marinum]
MPIATINGQKIHYTDAGAGPPVIATHATLMDLISLEPVTTKLVDAGYRVIAFDLRGHGETVYDRQPYTYVDVAGDVIGLADYLGVDRFIFVAEGQGAVVALRTALLAPQRVRALALIGPTAEAALDGENAALTAAMEIWCTQGPLPDIYRPTAAMATPTPDAADALMERWRCSAWREYRAAADALATRPTFIAELSTVACPALVVHSTQDVFVPMFLGKEVADSLGGPTAFVPVDTGHHAITCAFHPQIGAEILAWLPSVEDHPE